MYLFLHLVKHGHHYGTETPTGVLPGADQERIGCLQALYFPGPVILQGEGTDHCDVQPVTWGVHRGRGDTCPLAAVEISGLGIWNCNHGGGDTPTPAGCSCGPVEAPPTGVGFLQRATQGLGEDFATAE